MKSTVDWDSLRLFLAVARAGGLSGSARETGISPPTLGRRMAELEERLQVKLFERKQTGYTLTEAGHTLCVYAHEMEVTAGSIERWYSECAPRRTVRISAGVWTSRFLTTHIDTLWSATEPFAIDFVTLQRRVDIVRRQADIGLRNQAPSTPGLASRRLHDIAFAVYRARSATANHLPWIATDTIGDAGITPSAQWTREHHQDEVTLTTTDVRAVLDLVRAGAGQAVLPCFVGDADLGLIRIGDPIEALRGGRWLVLNDRARHDPLVRTIIDRIVALLAEHRGLFEGKAPVAA
ncbi:LysR family transcriptional regulator [Bauldia sp.]|uniref:LysR family transcriptional regulator n=1 Tax=Bauldia sp. TaxID=2575872 RepID=UPI003BAB0D0C